jgi:hypothetical protein
MNMAAKHVPARYSHPATLPFPPRNLKLLDPSNEDIMKALDEIKANQQCLLDNNNKLKQHVVFMDEASLQSYLFLQLYLGGSDWNAEINNHNNLPPL